MGGNLLKDERRDEKGSTDLEKGLETFLGSLFL